MLFRSQLQILWHPEAGEDLKLFEELVREARDYRASRLPLDSAVAHPA